MKENPLKQIDGIKMRRHYFTYPIAAHFILMVYIPYCILVFSIVLGKFNLSEWLSALLMSCEILLVFSIPWFLLAFLNRKLFGKIVGVLTDEGIHHADGFIPWASIRRIEYHIVLPSRRIRCSSDPEWHCRATVYTDRNTTVLIHAPRYLLRHAKKVNPLIETAIAKESRRTMLILSLVILLLIPIIALLKST